MVSVSTVVGFLFIVTFHAVIAAVATRFFRLRLHTRVGSFLYTILLVPIIYLVTTLVLSGFLGIGGHGIPDVQTAVLLTWVLPFTVGYSFELLWMPPPEDASVERPSARR